MSITSIQIIKIFPDEQYIELSVVGVAPCDLYGYKVHAVSANSDFVFPSDAQVSPGTVRVYSHKPPVGERFTFNSNLHIWNRTADTAQIVGPGGNIVTDFKHGAGAAGPGGNPGTGLPNDLSVTINGKTVPDKGTYDMDDMGEFTLPFQQDFIVTIHNNTGRVVSLLKEPPIVISDESAGFSVLSQPPPSSTPILKNRTSDFKLCFSPASAGTRSTVVSFETSVKNRNPFTFTLTGAAQQAVRSVRSTEQTIACTPEFLAFVRRDGQLWLRKEGNWGILAVKGDEKVVAITSYGHSHLLILTDTGELWAMKPTGVWDYSKVTDGCLLFSVDIATLEGSQDPGWLMTNPAIIAIKSDGSLLAPGPGAQGGGGGTGDFTLDHTVILQRGARNFSMALKSDGTLLGWGQCDQYQCGAKTMNALNKPRVVALPRKIVHISASKNPDYAFCLAVDEDGAIWGWGRDMGCLGTVMTPEDRQEEIYQIGPQKIDLFDGVKFKSVFCGASQGEAFAIDEDGILWSWGYSLAVDGSSIGTLGRDNALPGEINEPNIVLDLTDEKNKVVSVAFSGRDALILTANGALYYFGCSKGGSAAESPSNTPRRLTGLVDHNGAVGVKENESGAFVANSGQVYLNVAVGEPQVSRTFTVTNTGKGILKITSIDITSHPDYAISPRPVLNDLSSGASLTFTVIFSPKSVGTTTVQVTIGTGAPAAPHSFSLSGTGAPPISRVDVSDNSAFRASGVTVDFGNDLWVGRSVQKQFTITNRGIAPLSGLKIWLSGGSAPFQFTTPPSEGDLGVGQSTYATVSLSPAALDKPYNAVLTIQATGLRYVLNLTGRAANPRFKWEVKELDGTKPSVQPVFLTAKKGGRYFVALTIANMSNSNNPNELALSLDDFKASSPAITLTPHYSYSVEVTKNGVVTGYSGVMLLLVGQKGSMSMEFDSPSALNNVEISFRTNDPSHPRFTFRTYLHSNSDK